MDDVVMTTSSEASFPPGLEGAAVPPGGESVALEGIPAQNLPELAPGDTIMDKIDDDAKIDLCICNRETNRNKWAVFKIKSADLEQSIAKNVDCTHAWKLASKEEIPVYKIPMCFHDLMAA